MSRECQDEENALNRAKRDSWQKKLRCAGGNHHRFCPTQGEALHIFSFLSSFFLPPGSSQARHPYVSILF